MRDDLISRKALIENLNRFAPEHYTSLVNDLIMKQPTAFDTKKVMEEMHDSAELIVERGEWYVPLYVALEIAEKGGVRWTVKHVNTKLLGKFQVRANPDAMKRP